MVEKKNKKANKDGSVVSTIQSEKNGSILARIDSRARMVGKKDGAYTQLDLFRAFSKNVRDMSYRNEVQRSLNELVTFVEDDFADFYRYPRTPISNLDTYLEDGYIKCNLPFRTFLAHLHSLKVAVIGGGGLDIYHFMTKADCPPKESKKSKEEKKKAKSEQALVEGILSGSVPVDAPKPPQNLKSGFIFTVMETEGGTFIYPTPTDEMQTGAFAIPISREDLLFRCFRSNSYYPKSAVFQSEDILLLDEEGESFDDIFSDSNIDRGWKDLLTWTTSLIIQDRKRNSA